MSDLVAEVNTYEITEGPAPYSFEAPGGAIAFAVVIQLGAGKYGYRNLKDGSDSMPGYQIMGAADAFARQTFGMEIDKLLNMVVSPKHVGDLYRALRTVQLGLPGNRSGVYRPVLGRDLEQKAHRLANTIANAVAKRVQAKPKIIH